ncbi:alr0857 family protein [Prochlorothrix hollandica]|uniref:Uncharacterized protein n=1 Tax=Prochlorothrix hollandica PCC 9006 = CALU 1027 TaxID=317619 RepID=A0A0M2PUH6_PROHO|nr:alr0857 family protein [Prochlorothrix hollandica]KKI98303.1 hypothetical protein PROH_19175 [Prochlorothrix hollandica PCC 9006 = CALU 1027]
MLKLIYTETGFHLERVAAPLEVLVTQRVALALRFGQTLHLEPGKASFLIPAHTEELLNLELSLPLEESQRLTIASVDEGLVELTVTGTWLAATATADEGLFFTVFSDRTEFLIHKVWQASKSQISCFG